MNLAPQELFRVAHLIWEQIQALEQRRLEDVRAKLSSLAQLVKPILETSRQLQVCQNKHWLAAASKLMDRIPVRMGEVRHQMELVQEMIREGKRQSVSPSPSVRDIYQELIQADEEFGHLAYVPDVACLAVQTEPIELQGVYLGAFEIKLHVNHLGDLLCGRTYLIEALDPNPAKNDWRITHPHVSDGHLCAGDASAPIHAALSSGRICDFFVLVRSVLTNYNPNSPYVRLEDWDGVACYECGITVPEDSHYSCDHCGEPFCNECIACCQRCEIYFCHECIRQCPLCEESVCNACLSECPHCERSLCPNCIDDQACECRKEELEAVGAPQTSQGIPA